MNLPSTCALLDTLEQSRGRSPSDKALTLLALVSPGEDPDKLQFLPIGERDALLAGLRERMFGRGLETVIECPACHDALEFELDSRVLFEESENKVSQGELRIFGYHLHYRLPTSVDLLSVSRLPDLESAHGALLERCIEEIQTETGDSIDWAQLPEEITVAVEQAMEAADPHANPMLMLDCPNCGYQWQLPFDILDFFLRELNAWAGQLLRDVHYLASAYGWSEKDILLMSPWRRRAYLELLGT